MSDDEDNFDAVAAAVRSGIHDAYRLGLGAAIQVVETFAYISSDPYTFAATVEELRKRSVDLTLKGPIA